MTSRRSTIVAQIRQEIVAGRSPADSRLESQRDLAARFGVAGVTVQTALKQLERDGFIESRSRSGTFVVAKPPHLNQYALVFPFDPANRFAPEYWSRYFQALTQAAVRIQQETGKRMMMFHGIDWHADSEDRMRLIAHIERQLLAGIIFTTHPFSLVNTPIFDEPDTPRVAIMSGGAARYPQIPIVYFDYALWIDKALDHLVTLGRRRVALIDFSSNPDFHARFQAGLAKRNMVSYPRWTQLVSTQHRDGARRAVELLMNDREPPDAILVDDDNFVEQALAGLAAAGVKVASVAGPCGDNEVAVVGHANFPVPPAKVLPVRLLGYDATLFLRTCVDLIDRQRQGENVPPETILPALWEEEVGMRVQPVVSTGWNPATCGTTGCTREGITLKQEARRQAGSRKPELAVS